MKRVGKLFDKIIDINNIKLAIRNAAKGKSDRRIAKKLLNNIDEFAIRIRDIILDPNWTPSKYHEMIRSENPTKKERLIHAPKYYPDLIIQWALMQVLEEVLNRSLDPHSYCNVKGKGNFKAAKYVKSILKKNSGNKYCLKCDITKYYQHVDPTKLKQLIRRRIKDKKVLILLDKIIDSHPSLPIGNYTSQILANFYLQNMDKYIRTLSGVCYYVRYMDDFIVFGDNKRKLHKARRLISNFISDYNLTLKNNWQIFPTSSRRVDFCGLATNSQNSHIRRSIYIRIQRTINKLHRGNYSLINCRRYYSYKGWLDKSDSRYLYSKLNTKSLNKKRMKTLIRRESKIL